MSLDTYTRYVPLHKAASFWGNYVSALKGKIRFLYFNGCTLLMYSCLHSDRTASKVVIMLHQIVSNMLFVTCRSQLFYYLSIPGNADLCAAPEPRVTHYYPSITETLPPVYPGFRHEFGKLENLQWRSRRANSVEPTRVLPDANDR